MKKPVVYIVANKRKGTLYTGVTSDLLKRIYQHKQGGIKGFSQKYHCRQLVYYEQYEDMENAILREKQIKAGSRLRKIKLIENENSDWEDLYEALLS